MRYLPGMARAAQLRHGPLGMIHALRLPRRDGRMPGRDVVVVGTGVLGSAVSLAAADVGLDVTLVGPGEHQPGTASAAAGAMLGVLGEHTTAEQQATHGHADLLFRHTSALMWPDWLDRIAEHSGTRIPLDQGTVIIANLDHPPDRDNLDAVQHAAGLLGLPAEQVDPRHVPGLRPAPRHAPVAALSCPHEGWVDARDLLAALTTACRAHPRIHQVTGTVSRVLLSDRSPAAAGVLLDEGTRLGAGQVVLAAGAATAALLTPLASVTGPLPQILAAKGVSLMMDVPAEAQPPGVIRTPNRDFACGLHLVPRARDGLYVGATNRFTTTPGSGATAGEQLNLLHGLLHQFRVDLRTATITGVGWGNRPATTDGAPLIGPCELPGLLLATGTYRNGILMAPAVAGLITALLAGKSAPLDNPYQPVDRSRGSQTGQRLLVEGATQMAANFLDPDGTLPLDRETQLATTLGALLDLALSDDQTTQLSRTKLRDQLAAHPTVEGVGRIFDTWEDQA